ncbi:hypothetical protein HMPREF1248_0474 [Coriobacteriaceae bacterium BV3Ac1]|nr:hypothetical protein HMPREF1248_0474 [Coriobacteriaceae bacterium BV3Ac1]
MVVPPLKLMMSLFPYETTLFTLEQIELSSSLISDYQVACFGIAQDELFILLRVGITPNTPC